MHVLFIMNEWRMGLRWRSPVSVSWRMAWREGRLGNTPESKYEKHGWGMDRR